MRTTRLIVPALALVLSALGCDGGSGPSAPPVDGVGTVGPSGGSVVLSDRAGVTAPPGAVQAEVTITITAVSTPAALLAAGAIGQAYRLEPEGLQFQAPVDVFVFLSDQARGGRPIGTIELVSTGPGGNGVEVLADIRRNAVPGGFEIRGRTPHFSVVSAAVADQPPTADAGPDQTVTLGETVQLDGTGSQDPEGGDLTYEWTIESAPEGSEAALSDADTPDPSFVPDLEGTYTLRLTVTDPQGSSASDTVVIEVEAPNQPPVADAGPDRSGAPGDTFELDGSGSSDPDGDDLAYQWTRVSGPNVTLQNADQEKASFTANQPGTYVFELEVSDGEASSTDTVRVVVNQPGNRAPTASVTASSVSVQTGQAVNLDASGSTDPDGDPLTYEWEVVSAPGGSTPTLTATGAATATFTATEVGTYVIQVRVSDGKGGVATATVTISVSPPPNRPPQGTLTVDDQVLVGAAVTATVDVSDPEGQPVTLQMTLQKPAGSGATLQVNGGTATFTADVPGTYTVQVVASDGVNQTTLSGQTTAYPSVAGSYPVTFTLTSVSGGFCPEEFEPGATTDTSLPVQQSAANPGTVIVDLSALVDQTDDSLALTLQPDGSASGSGQVVLRQNGSSITANVSMSLQFSNGSVSGTFSFSAGSFCQGSGSLEPN